MRSKQKFIYLVAGYDNTDKTLGWTMFIYEKNDKSYAKVKPNLQNYCTPPREGKDVGEPPAYKIAPYSLTICVHRKSGRVHPHQRKSLMYLTKGLPEDHKWGGKQRPYMPGSGALRGRIATVATHQRTVATHQRTVATHQREPHQNRSFPRNKLSTSFFILFFYFFVHCLALGFSLFWGLWFWESLSRE